MNLEQEKWDIIDGKRHRTSEPLTPSDYFIEELTNRHPLLRCVLAITGEMRPWNAVMWGKDNMWARQRVPKSDYRYVLRDKLEGIQFEGALY